MTDAITIKKFPNLERFGDRAGKDNENLLNAELFAKIFQPYDSVKEENPEARAAGRALIAEGTKTGPKRRTFVFVNNRLEGNAQGIIAAMLKKGPTA